MLLDLKLAVRRLLATPLFTAFAVLSLSAGIGVTTAVYSIIDALFLRESRVLKPDEVAFVAWPRDGQLATALLSEPDFRDLRREQRSFSMVSASAMFRPNVTTMSSAETLTAEAVDGSYFATLGVRATLGRVLDRTDDDAGARVVVVSWRLWRERYAADPGAIGRTISISGHPFEIVGVVDRTFEGPGTGFLGTALWTPLSAARPIVPAWSTLTIRRDQRMLRVFGRLGPGVSAAAASSEMASIGKSLDHSYPVPYLRSGQSERSWSTQSALAQAADGNMMRRFGLVLAGFVSLVLIVACTNIANLTLARGTSRQQEFAIRHALGASRRRLVREQCIESLVIALSGGVGSYIVFRGLQALLTTSFNIPLPMGGRWMLSIRPELDPMTIAAAGGALVAALLVFGLEPALQLTRVRDIRGAIASAADGGGPIRTARHRLLLRWQVAVSAGFFIVATMFVKYTVAEARHDSGVDMERLAVATLNVETHHFDQVRMRRTIDRLLELSRANGMFEAFAVSTGLPFGAAGSHTVTLLAPGRTDASDLEAGTLIEATPGIFLALGIPILRGRAFDDRDPATGEPIAILSEFTARRILGSAEGVGQQLIIRRAGQPDVVASIVGIARDTDVRAIFGDPRPLIYVPLRQPAPLLTITARSPRSAPAALDALREMLRQADPDLAVDAIGIGRQILAGPFVFVRAIGVTVLGLGALTLLLAMVGLFGIQTHIVSNRTREIGIRMSFGASAAQIQRMILRDGIRPVLEGLAIGLAIGLAGRGIIREYMELDIAIVDTWMLLAVPIPLILAGISASYLPAHRAAAVDPSIALRQL